MTAPPSGTPRPDESIPLGQRIYDNWFLLLLAGIAVMGIIYTAWGFWEVMTLPPAELP